MHRSNWYIKFFLSGGFLLLSLWLHATHNRAGEITYKQIGDYTIEVTVTTYTKTTSIQADRDSILLDWGDETMEYLKRSNGEGEDLGNNIQKNVYIKTHIYPGRNTYTISMTDPNRVAEIQNLNFPNSENIKFHLRTTFTFTNPDFNGSNSSVQLLQAPIDIACVGETFIHIPNGFDEDGDSLVYELGVPLGENGEEVPDYQLPNEIIPNNNSFSFNTEDGQIIWDSPQKAGEYNVSFYVNEYRDGVLLNRVLRDMQIFVLNCNNEPPELTVPDEICVVAGESVEFTIGVSDPDIGQQVEVSATGGPFDLEVNPAIFIAPIGYADPPYTATFKWDTRCEDISNNEYQIVFRAVDNFFVSPNVVTGLADLKSVKIKVVGPAPENLEGEADNQSVQLTWDSPYACEETENDFFQGFSVWRHVGSIDIPQDTCAPGIEGQGYTKVSGIDLITDLQDGKYTFTDQNLEKGRTYCYRVVAEFAQISITGNPYNFVQSLVSNEVCLQLARDIPLLTKASVLVTDQDMGMVQTEWILPVAEDLDTMQTPGPYRYQLQRADGIDGTNFQDVPSASFTTQFFDEEVTTSFLDNQLNTMSQAYNYRIAFYANGVNNLYDYSPSSSTVYLTIKSSDEINVLEWDANTSWINTHYHIYKLNDNTNLFELVDSTEQQSYEDDGLINGVKYCYYVQTFGSYQIPSLDFVIDNNSNESCGIPLDTIPPCTPEITVSNACAEAGPDTPEEDFVNTVTWNRVDLVCENSDDVAAYRIYYKPDVNTDFQLIEEVEDIQIISIDHNPDFGLTACYAITSVDSIGNESPLSEIQCIDDCPSYILPNAFTPNLDGNNDVFRPILNRFVSRVDFRAYNEWGQKVFETQNPEILWEGTNFSGAALNDGVYYYTCEVFRTNTEGIENSFDFLKGYIQILKSE